MLMAARWAALSNKETTPRGGTRGRLCWDSWLRGTDSNRRPSGYEFRAGGPRPSAGVQIEHDTIRARPTLWLPVRPRGCTDGCTARRAA